jgi:hypothetical protein
LRYSLEGHECCHHVSFRAAFRFSGEILENAANKETAALLKRFSHHPEVQKAAAEFEHAQKLEETFLKKFEGQDFTSRSLEDESSSLQRAASRLMLF